MTENITCQDLTGCCYTTLRQKCELLERKIEKLEKEASEREYIEKKLIEKQKILKEQNISLVRKSIELSDIKRELEDKNFDLEQIRKDLQKAMSDLRQAHDELELRVEERTAELKKTNEMLLKEIEERKQAESALHENQEKLRATLESTADGILVVNDKGRVTHTNMRFINMWKIAPEIIKSSDDKLLIDFVMDQLETPERFQRKIEELYRSSDDDTDMLYFKDGRVFERYSCPLIQDGKMKGRVWSFRDLTQRTQAEKERRALEKQLRRAEKMEALGRLAGGVAHDLNNVLSGLVGYPDLILSELPEESPLYKMVLTVKKSGQRAAAIVEDLLTLTRRGAASAEIINVNDAVKEYFKSPEYDKLITLHPHVRIKTDLAENLSNIICSPVHMLKTVMNLITNAAEAVEDEGKVVVATRNEYIDLPISGYDKVQPGEYVMLRVKDNGIGIPADEIEKIFEPFYTRKVMGRSGTGLGMAVVWGTVNDHNGYIDVKSKEGRGTTFDLYFPATDRQPQHDQPPPVIDSYKGNNEKILVVDDIEAQRDMAVLLLDNLGYTVNAVSSGEEALRYLENNSADLIILDMIMEPGMDGLDTYRAICRKHPGMPAVIASGYSETDRIREAQRLGAGEYVKKPYTMEEIGLAVQKELERHGID